MKKTFIYVLFSMRNMTEKMGKNPSHYIEEHISENHMNYCWISLISLKKPVGKHMLLILISIILKFSYYSDI